MAHDDALGGWNDKGKVAYFLEKADVIVPKRREKLRFLVALLPSPAQEPLSVLEGAGEPWGSPGPLKKSRQSLIASIISLLMP